MSPPFVFDLLAPCQARGHYFPIFGKMQTIAITLQKRCNRLAMRDSLS
jgi:hypothetical protein